MFIWTQFQQMLAFMTLWISALNNKKVKHLQLRKTFVAPFCREKGSSHSVHQKLEFCLIHTLWKPISYVIVRICFFLKAFFLGTKLFLLSRTGTLPKTSIAAENRPRTHNEKILFQPSIFQVLLLLVSGSLLVPLAKKKVPKEASTQSPANCLTNPPNSS